MKWQWEQMSATGRWCVVKSDERPDIRNGRLKKPEGQGPRVRNLKPLEQTEGTPE